MNELDTKATWRFHRDGREIAARAIGVRQFSDRQVVILRATDEALWIGEWSAKGATVVRGPVSLKEAVLAAEGIVFGVRDHGSVAALTNQLAVGLLMFNVALVKPSVLDPKQYAPIPDAPEVHAC
ncbi:conserved hypothetical protein [uncultured Alphaproteobacteria bacterium]|uniref:Uncharacterized protein n=1 Tax=uncultured Alphaproteobacteria bacterium TaxID=91750 RepID=A0A212KC27_9PROT|nr:conserved hypothetical protein [uncultured Alphaproteobacteria bacterium]